MMNTLQTIANETPELAPYLENLNHVDIKTIDGDVTLREFIANFISYQPFWMTFLYRVRWGFVRLLGMKQDGVPQPLHMKPEDVPMQNGQNAAFFTVDLAEENRFWLASASEPHLTAWVGVVLKPLASGGNRFYVLTLVRYHKWTGPVYFNTIRPFHHMVVNNMTRAGIGNHS